MQSLVFHQLTLETVAETHDEIFTVAEGNPPSSWKDCIAPKSAQQLTVSVGSQPFQGRLLSQLFKVILDGFRSRHYRTSRHWGTVVPGSSNIQRGGKEANRAKKHGKLAQEGPSSTTNFKLDFCHKIDLAHVPYVWLRLPVCEV